MKNYITTILLLVMSIQLQAQGFLHDKMLEGIIGNPAFYINGYAFYPDRGIIGHSAIYVHPMSSSGFGKHYIAEIKGADYNSFKFLNIERGIAKDKNTIYFGGKKLDIPQNAQTSAGIYPIVIVDSDKYGYIKVISFNKLYILFGRKNEVKEYTTDKIISDIAFIRNDSLFIFFDDTFMPYPKETFADIKNLRKISRFIYQDTKNLYKLTAGGTAETIADEKITAKHSFIADEQEQRNNDNRNFFWIGKKAFYNGNGKVYNYRLQSYKFFYNSYYFFYNGCLSYFTDNERSNYPIGISSSRIVDFDEFEEGLNDDIAPQRDYNKTKTLGQHMLLYNNTELFYKNDSVSYPESMDIEKLEYVGFFPYRLYVEFIPVSKAGYCESNAPILRYNNLTLIYRYLLYLYRMKKEDFRTVDERGREAVRRCAIKMIQSGLQKKEVASFLGVRPNTITAWCKSYDTLGLNGLKSKKRGVSSESAKLLSNAQEHEIQKMIIDKMPDQLKLNFSLWTRQAVKELIEREFGIILAITTMGEYLRKWVFSPQKPQRRAYEQNPKAVAQWLSESYPAIKSQAKQEKAEIHWGDETGVRNACHHGRSYAPKGHTPTKLSMSQRFNVNMISSLTNQGKVQFMIYTDSMNADRLIQFMVQLIKNSSVKIYLIFDNLKVHHCILVKQWVEEHKQEIALFYLPSYSPDKNPDEYLNCDLKQGLSVKPSPRNQEKLKGNIQEHMNLLSQSPERVKKYFKHKSIEYAA